MGFNSPNSLLCFVSKSEIPLSSPLTKIGDSPCFSNSLICFSIPNLIAVVLPADICLKKFLSNFDNPNNPLGSPELKTSKAFLKALSLLICSFN